MAHSQQHITRQPSSQVLSVASIELNDARHDEDQGHVFGEVEVHAVGEVDGVVGEVLVVGGRLLVAVQGGGCEAGANDGEGEEGVEEAEAG